MSPADCTVAGLAQAAVALRGPESIGKMVLTEGPAAPGRLYLPLDRASPEGCPGIQLPRPMHEQAWAFDKLLTSTQI